MPAFAGMTMSDMIMTPPRAFDHIDTWVFDLDNTLYPHHVNLWQQVDKRIGEFVSAWLKVSPEEARRKRLEKMIESADAQPDLLKTHKERVEALNTYLSKLSEHHDMPRIGPG